MNNFIQKLQDASKTALFCLTYLLIFGQASTAMADTPEDTEAGIEPEVYVREEAESPQTLGQKDTPSDEERDKMISDIRTAIKKNRPDEAAKLVNELLTSNPNDPKAIRLKGAVDELQRANAISRLNAIDTEERLKNLSNLDERGIPYTEIMRFPDTEEMREIEKRTVPDRTERFEGMKEKTSRLRIIPEPKRPTPKEIEDALNIKISFEFFDTPLLDIIAFLQEKTGINVVASKDLPEKTVSLKLNDVDIKTALKYILPDGVSYKIEDDIVYILNDRLEMRVYDVRDLLINLEDRLGAASAAGGAAGSGEYRDANQRVQGLIKLITGTIAPQSWIPERGRITTREDRPGDLIIVNTEKVHKQIEDLLTSIRSAQHLQVSIEARFIEMSDNFLEDIGIELQKASISNPSTGTNLDFNVDTSAGAASAASQGLNLTYSILKDYQVDILLNAVQESKEAEVLTSPRITLSNTQRGSLRVIQEINYVSGYEIVSQIPQPVISVVQDGTVFDVRPVISTDRKHVFLEAHPDITRVLFETLPFPVAVPFAGPDGETVFQTLELTIEQPLVTHQELSVTVDVPDRGTLMIGGLGTTRKTKREGGVPILSKIPFVKRLFSRDSETIERTNLVIILKPTIIIRDEAQMAKEASPQAASAK